MLSNSSSALFTISQKIHEIKILILQANNYLFYCIAFIVYHLLHHKEWLVIVNITLSADDLGHMLWRGHRHALGHVDASLAEHRALFPEDGGVWVGHVVSATASRAVVLRRRRAGAGRFPGAAGVLQNLQIDVSVLPGRGPIQTVDLLHRHEWQLIQSEEQRLLMVLVPGLLLGDPAGRSGAAHYHLVIHDVRVKQRARHSSLCVCIRHRTKHAFWKRTTRVSLEHKNSTGIFVAIAIVWVKIIIFIISQKSLEY